MRLARLFILALILPSTTTVHSQSAPADGLKAEIVGVKIPDNRRPVITFKVSDSKAKPLSLEELDRDSVRFTIAAIKLNKSGESDYHNYVLTRVAGQEYVYKGEKRKPALAGTDQPDYDRRGTLARVSAGVFTYTFKTALPSDYDKRSTHVVGGELTRENRRYVANPLFEFVPAGGRVKVRRALIESASCNNCHDPLKAHGGSNREAGYCALCHTAQLTDPESGESLDFKFFIHKVHRGKLLPSVKGGKSYFTIGAGQRVADFSTIASPQMVVTEFVPKEYRNCAACHASPKVSNWKTLPSSVGCISCHDDVDLRTGKKHGPGPAAEGTCAECHRPEGAEFGPSIVGAHTFPGNSTQLPGIVFDILKIEGGKSGSNPVVTFSLKDKKGGPVNAAQMSNLGLVLAWPTVDYQTDIIEDARKAQPLGNGVHVYKFTYAIPAEASGSGAIGIQGYTLFDVKRPNGTVVEKGQRDVGLNVVRYFPITDQEAVPRRKAGSPRFLPVYGGPAANPAPTNFGEIRFPGDRRNCTKCHEKGANEIPLADGVLPTAIPQADGTVKHLPPIMSACVGCHTKEPAKAHMEAQVAAVGRESCVVCHGVGREFSVEKVHRR